MIKVKNLNKVYKTGKQEHQIIKNLNFSIKDGDFTIIMGSSGAGKSTLLYLLSGLDICSSGEIHINDSRVDNFSEKRWSLFRRQRIGFIHQGINLLPNMTIEDNVLLPGYLSGKSRKSVNETTERLFQRMNISKIAKNYPSQSSGGEQQRAAIARALVINPDIIFADEPTGALNSQHGHAVLNILTEINESGQSIVMVTHDIKAATRGNRILFIKDGIISGDLNFGKYNPEDAKSREKFVFEWLEERGW